MAEICVVGVYVHDTLQQFPGGIFAACQDAKGNLVELIEFRDN